MSRKIRRYRRNKGFEVRILMDDRYLPKDRRDLTIRMVQSSFTNLWLLLLKLKLFSRDKGAGARTKYLENKLFKLVCRRHTHLWPKK